MANSNSIYLNFDVLNFMQYLMQFLAGAIGPQVLAGQQQNQKDTKLFFHVYAQIIGLM